MRQLYVLLSRGEGVLDRRAHDFVCGIVPPVRVVTPEFVGHR